MAFRTNSAVPRIIEDNQSGQMTFAFTGGNFSITPGTDNASWFETIKDAHRNGRSVTITDDDSVTRNSFEGSGCFLPLDLHNT